MAEYSAIARPYAQAVFELATTDGTMDKWLSALQVLRVVVSNEKMQKLITNPSVEDKRCGELMIDLCAEQLDDKSRNFVRLLAINGRLAIIQEVARLYEEYRAEAMRTVDAEILTALPIGDAEQKSIAAMLKKRLNREVTLTVKIDKSLIGGVIVRAGDLVIDGSVSGKLDKLRLALVH